MPKLTNSKLPKYCRLSQRNIGYFWKDGKRVYLPGKYNSPESLNAYNEQMALLLEERVDEVAGKKQLQTATARISKNLTVLEVFVRYLEFAKTHYVKHGEDTGTAYQYQIALEPAKEDYGHLRVSKFTKHELKKVQQKMVDSGLSRGVINTRITKIIHVFDWFADEADDEPSYRETALKLHAVKPLEKGRTIAPDHPRREAVADAVVDATLPFLSRVVADMVRIQRMAGMRPNEVFKMTWSKIDTSDDIWIYSPIPKPEHFNIDAWVPLNKFCQAILERYKDTPKDAIIFSPKRAVREQAEEKASKRKTKVQPSQMKRKVQKSVPRENLVGDRYNKDSYRICVERATQKYNKAEIEAAKKENREPVLLPHWTPYLLRHRAGTNIYRTQGKDAAQAMLGHARSTTTDIYIHEEVERLKEIARKMDEISDDRASSTTG